MQILRILDNTAKISSRKNCCETLNSRSLSNLTAHTTGTTLRKMYGVQLPVMNRWFAREEKPTNMIGMLFLQFLMTVFQKMLLGIFRLIGVNWPPNSCSFLIISASLWLEREWTEVLNLAWKIPLDDTFYEDSRVITWLKKVLEEVDNSRNLKGEKVVK